MFKKNVFILIAVAVLIVALMAYFVVGGDNEKRELYQGLLATERNTYHTVILHDEASKLDEQDIYLPSQALEGGTRWIEYDPSHSVDYKEEFEVERFPVYLVFDSKKLVLKTYELEELNSFFQP